MYEISPTRKPFQYHAWLELPFPLAVRVNHTFFGNYKSSQVEINITVESNVYKVMTGSFWQQAREAEEWATRVRAGEKEPSPSLSWTQLYVTQSEVYDLVKTLESQKEIRHGLG